MISITLEQQMEWLRKESADRQKLMTWLDGMPEWVWELMLRARNALATEDLDPQKGEVIAHEIDLLLGTRRGADDGVPFDPNEYRRAPATKITVSRPAT